MCAFFRVVGWFCARSPSFLYYGISAGVRTSAVVACGLCQRQSAFTSDPLLLHFKIVP